MNEIKEKIIRAVENCIGKEKKAGVLFSGGVDSSVIAKVASSFADVTCYVAGIEGSHDLEFAPQAAEALGLKLTTRVLKRQEIAAYSKKVGFVLDSCDLIQVGVGIPIYACCEIAKEEVLLTGAGADEIFGGYSRFKKMTAKQLGEELKETYKKMLEVDLPRDVVIGEANGKVVKAPFIEASLEPLGEVDKPTLRKIALELGIPKFIAHKPKKAAQYGSGVDRLLKDIL